MSRWSNKYVIGLTGNIATGKSVVRQMLQHSGAYTIDADSLGHQAMMPGAPAYKPVIQTFGSFIVGSDKKINRQMLGQMVFSSPDALKKLEAITHPIIRQAVDALVKRSKQRVVVIEAIKLLDGDIKDWVDEIWVVDASRKTQYTRLIRRRKMSESDAKQRILAQSSQENKVKQAKVVIQNDGDVEQTWKQVQAEWKRIKTMLSAPKSPTAGMTAEDTAPAAQEEEEAQTISIDGLTVKRGMPGSAQDIANFVNAHGKSAEEKSRMDIMLSFGQKSYLVAEDDSKNIVSLMGWTVENLVTRMDEFYVKPGMPIKAAVHAIVVAVEEASKDLQSEAAFLFLPTDSNSNIVDAFKANGYVAITVRDIKIPVWREAVEEQIRQGERIVLWKQLRKDRVLQPI